MDVDYFMSLCKRAFTAGEKRAIQDTVLQAYRWQYIISGVQEPRFVEVLGSLVSSDDLKRINAALAPMLN